MRTDHARATGFMALAEWCRRWAWLSHEAVNALQTLLAALLALALAPTLLTTRLGLS